MEVRAACRHHVFGGDSNGRFRAFDQDTGKVLWEIKPGLDSDGVPDYLYRQRQAVRCSEHWQFREHSETEPPGAGVAS